MFISFEGIDGSGKSTQARLLAETLRTLGHSVLLVREPGGTELGEQIRSLLLDPTQHITPRSELLLFSAARAQLVEVSIRPALASGAVVVADRFYDSTTAYQGGGRRIADFGQMESIHAMATDGLSPDLTILVDVDLNTAMARRLAVPDDRMEAEDRSFHERVRHGYLALATRHPDRIHVVNGSQDVLSQQQQIARAVADRMVQ